MCKTYSSNGIDPTPGDCLRRGDPLLRGRAGARPLQQEGRPTDLRAAAQGTLLLRQGLRLLSVGRQGRAQRLPGEQPEVMFREQFKNIELLEYSGFGNTSFSS